MEKEINIEAVRERGVGSSSLFSAQEWAQEGEEKKKEGKTQQIGFELFLINLIALIFIFICSVCYERNISHI